MTDSVSFIGCRPVPTASLDPVYQHRSGACAGRLQAGDLGRPSGPLPGWIRRTGGRTPVRASRERPHQALGMKVPGRRLRARVTRLSRLGGAHLSVPRCDLHGDAMRADLLQGPEGQSQPCLRRPERRRHPGGRTHLARHLHALRFGLLRRRDVPTRTDRESVRAATVTHVSGMKCYLCLRNRPRSYGVLTVASWNLIVRWLRHIDGLRGPLTFVADPGRAARMRLGAWSHAHKASSLSAHFASGSGRSWKCTALLVWPLPPS
jgi:hypothetical protein